MCFSPSRIQRHFFLFNQINIAQERRASFSHHHFTQSFTQTLLYPSTFHQAYLSMSEEHVDLLPTFASNNKLCNFEIDSNLPTPLLSQYDAATVQIKDGGTG
jgi:hypothetical protein